MSKVKHTACVHPAKETLYMPSTNSQCALPSDAIPLCTPEKHQQGSNDNLKGQAV